MTAKGFFELYPAARPALPAGRYQVASNHDLQATPPHGGPVTIPVDQSEFHLHIDAPRYAMPPDQILSTFPPAGSEGDWRERLPQIVLKRRTLPWERNPIPGHDPHTSPPWLALVVIAEGEGRVVTDVDVAQCVTGGVHLGDDADVPKGKYLEVPQSVIDKVFPCQDELDLLCHVRKVDLADTELALGDDDGYLAVVLSNRLPQPGPDDENGVPTTLKYTACLINLEGQVPGLPATEPNPLPYFELADVTALRDEAMLAPLPDATLDQLVMGLGPGAVQRTSGVAVPHAVPKAIGGAAVGGHAAAPYSIAQGAEPAAASWATGPVRATRPTSGEVAVMAGTLAGVNAGLASLLDPLSRFPVLVSWEFRCTGSGGFERLMNELEVGLLGTVGADQAPPVPETAPTGHVALDHRTRHGEPARSWYRGPLGPQPTLRTEPDAQGKLSIAHTSDALRRVVPDGREDVSLAALFEIGRLLTLSKPDLVAALMAWRRELFGAARARELADRLAASVVGDVGLAAAGGRAALEELLRARVIGAFAAAPAGSIAPAAAPLTGPRIPDHLRDVNAQAVLAGLGVAPGVIARAVKRFGVDGLGQVPVPVARPSTAPVAKDERALAVLTEQVSDRVDALVASSLKVEPPERPPTAPPPRVRIGRRKDHLDRLIENAALRHSEEG